MTRSTIVLPGDAVLLHIVLVEGVQRRRDCVLLSLSLSLENRQLFLQLAVLLK